MIDNNYINERREPIKKIEESILGDIIEKLRNCDYRFDDQKRNIHVNCCLCNDCPEYVLVIKNIEHSIIYMCWTCRKKFENRFFNSGQRQDTKTKRDYRLKTCQNCNENNFSRVCSVCKTSICNDCSKKYKNGLIICNDENCVEFHKNGKTKIK